MDETAVVILIIVVAFIYFMPTIVAAIDKKQNAAAIFLLNLFLGWTLIGWVAALVWAATKDMQPTIVDKPSPPRWRD